MKDYGLVAKLTAKEDALENLISLLIEASEVVATLEGCYQYIVSKDTNSPNTVVVFEIWTSKEAHDKSLQNEKVKALITQAIPLLNEMPAGGQELEVMGGLFLNV